jgi:hypothetical protein
MRAMTSFCARSVTRRMTSFTAPEGVYRDFLQGEYLYARSNHDSDAQNNMFRRIRFLKCIKIQYSILLLAEFFYHDYKSNQVYHRSISQRLHLSTSDPFLNCHTNLFEFY